MLVHFLIIYFLLILQIECQAYYIISCACSSYIQQVTYSPICKRCNKRMRWEIGACYGFLVLGGFQGEILFYFFIKSADFQTVLRTPRCPKNHSLESRRLATELWKWLLHFPAGWFSVCQIPERTLWAA